MNIDFENDDEFEDKVKKNRRVAKEEEVLSHT